MKQKRKVKSLIPQKKFTSKSLKTAGLVFLGSALYLASITLLSTSVAFGANDGAQAKDFEEFNWTSPISDKKEVVYAARFATIENLNNRIIDIFMNKDGVLYITPNPVIVNPLNNDGNGIAKYNFVDTENKIYGHVLGGKDNYVYSNNVTIIAGEGNKVNTGSDNATMLGGENNTINQGNGVPSAIIGGSENEIKENHNGSNVIIGGNNNTIKNGVSGSAILGGKSNTIESNTSNAIIGGSNVTNDKNNVFAYSTNNFEPENPNSFFLNMKKGVGINMEASGALNGLYVSGAVSLGDIDIKSKPCNSSHRDNYGLEGKYDGCLVGCTIDGWKMFDRGAKCEEICNENIDIFKECPRDAAIPDSPDDYTAFCTGLAKTDNATQCPELQAQMQNYKNVVFETKLIDSERECPNSEDKCIFKCKTGFHLTGLITNGYNSGYEYKKCYEDCPLPWDANTKVPTNTIITGYNRDSVFCSSNDPDDSPEHDHCGNHKQTLICYSGQRYDYNKDQNSRRNIPNTTHKYETCETKEYDCPSSYGLTKNYIINDLRENDNGKTWNTDDRSTTTLTRGKYKLCLDYDPQSDHDLECLERDNDNPHTKHYKFVGCNEPEYYEFTGEDLTMRCMKSCTFDTNSGQIRVKHNESTDLYLSNNTTCPTPCEKQTFTCNDGKRENKNGKSIDDYKYTSCNLNSQGHEGYDISENDYIKNKNNSTTYDHIKISVKDKDIFSCKEEIRYKITGCADGYHLSPTLKYCIKEGDRGECEPLVDYSHRTDSDDELFYSSEFGTLYRYAGSTRAEKVWTSWDDPRTVSRNKCHSDCDFGFTRRKTGGKNYCVKDGACHSDPKNNIGYCEDGSYQSTSSENGNTYWTCPGDGYGSNSEECGACADGYVWDDSEKICKEIKNGACKNDDEKGSCGGLGGRSNIRDIENGYEWDCYGENNGDTAYNCHTCKEGYKWENDKCVRCDGTNCDCTVGDCPTPVIDEDGICNNDEIYGCNEGHEISGKDETDKTKTIRYCDGTGNGKRSDQCFICKEGYYKDGNSCKPITTSAQCGDSNGKTYTQESSITDKCSKGNYTPITYDIQTSKWSWNCYDTVGSVPCGATKLECGDAAGNNSYSNKDQIKENLKCKPSNSNSTSITENNNEFSWRCKGDGNSDILCKATKVNFSCSKVYQNAYLISGSDSNLTEATTSQLYDNETAANGKKCAYVCKAGYHKDGEVCKINTCSTNTPGENTIRGSGTPSTHNKTWDYKDSTTLGACEWTCESGYQRSLNKCVEKQCGTTGLPSSMNGVLTGKSTYVGTDNNRNWQYNTSLGACQWKCAETYILNDAGNGCRKIENGQCKNGVLYGCEVPSSNGTWKSDIIENGKIIGVKYECKGKDQTATCEYRCPSGKIFSGDTLHNGTCVTQTSNEPICSGGYNYPLPKDAEQNPLAYRYNKILDNFYEVEVDDGDEVPDEIEWYYADHDERVYYDYDNRSCMWTCADGYEHDKDTNKCVAIKCGDNEFYDNETNKCTNICGSVSREFQVSPLTHQTTYTNNYFITGACKGGRNFVGNPSRGDGVTIGRNGPNGCGPFKLKRQCSNGTSTITCDDQNAKVVIFGVNYNNYNNTLTVSQNPFNCFGGNQPCASARSVKVRLTFGLMGGSPTCETNISPTDQERMDYNISNLCPESNGYYGAPRKIEVVGDNTYTANDYLYEDYEVALPEVYVGGGTSCPDFGDAIRIY